MEDTTEEAAAERARLLSGLAQATRRLERSASTLDAWLLKAHAQGATYSELAQATGWDRRTVSRHLAKLTALHAYLEHFEKSTAKGENHGNA